MAAFTTKLSLGASAFVVRSGLVRSGLDPHIVQMTVGQIRVTETMPSCRPYETNKCYLEEYMCIESGVGSGSVWEYGKNIFATEAEAEAGVVAAKQAAYFERRRREAARAEYLEQVRQNELKTLAGLKQKYES